MTFAAQTAYANDYEYLEFVEDVSWQRPGEVGPQIVTGLKARFGDFDTPDLIALAAGLGLSSEAAHVAVWEPRPDDVPLEDWQPQFEPAAGHVLRREATGEGWMVQSAKRSRFGHWTAVCEKEVANA